MAKVFVANGKHKKKQAKKQQKRSSVNPLPLVVMNPTRTGGTTKMAKHYKKKKKGGGGYHHRKNPSSSYKRRYHRRNPGLPESATNSAKLVFASALALLANVYIPGWLLGFFGV